MFCFPFCVLPVLHFSLLRFNYLFIKAQTITTSGFSQLLLKPGEYVFKIDEVHMFASKDWKVEVMPKILFQVWYATVSAYKYKGNHWPLLRSLHPWSLQMLHCSLDRTKVWKILKVRQYSFEICYTFFLWFSKLLIYV